MILDIPFIISENKCYIDNIISLQTEYIHNEIGNLSLILNRSFDLYKIPIFINSKINYTNWTEYDNFNNLLNGIFCYRPISNSNNKINTHYIPKLPHGNKISEMIIPIKSNLYQYINSIDISHITISYNNDISIKLNKEPILYIYTERWYKKNIIKHDYKLHFKMDKWGYFIPINKINIDIDNVLSIIVDGFDFIVIDDYLQNIDKLNSIYLRLFL